jgi:hypothetical protein
MLPGNFREGRLQLFLNGSPFTDFLGQVTYFTDPGCANGLALCGGVPCRICVNGCTPVACTDDCPNPNPDDEWVLKVSEFSEYAAVQPCPQTDTARLKVGRLHTPPGDDTLKFKGSFTRPVPATDFDPATDGIELVLEDAEGARAAIAIPGGFYDGTSGWRGNVGGKRWKYVNHTGTPPGGIVQAVFRDRSAKTPGLMAFTFRGRDGAYVAAGPVAATLTLPGSDECYGTAFGASFGGAAPPCVADSRGRTLKCR